MSNILDQDGSVKADPKRSRRLSSDIPIAPIGGADGVGHRPRWSPADHRRERANHDRVIRTRSIQPADWRGEALALIAYAVGLHALAGFLVVVSAFYALQDTQPPVRIGTDAIPFNLGYNGRLVTLAQASRARDHASLMAYGDLAGSLGLAASMPGSDAGVDGSVEYL